MGRRAMGAIAHGQKVVGATPQVAHRNFISSFLKQQNQSILHMRLIAVVHSQNNYTAKITNVSLCK